MDEPDVSWMSAERRKVYDRLRADNVAVDDAIEASGVMTGEAKGDVVE